MELKAGSPEEAGVRAEVVPLLRERGEAWVSDGRNPSIVLLAARRGVIFFHEAFGVSSAEDNAPALTIDAIFPLASLTKPFTAAAVLTLVESGKLGLNRPVQEYIPEFSVDGADKVMIHHLLTHTSGLSDDDFEKALENYENGLESVEVPAPPETQTLRIARSLSLIYGLPLHFEPGSQMEYTDMGIYLAAEIVRRLSGQSLDKYYREQIYESLGMTDSSMVVPKEVRDRVVQRPEDAPGAIMDDEAWMDHPSPSGGMYSTAGDVARFAQMLLNRGSYGDRRVLSPASVAAMTRNQIPGVSADMLEISFPEASWGLSMSVAHPYKRRVYGEPLLHSSYFNHGGYGGVEMWVDPVSEIVGAYFSVALDVDESDFTRYHADLFMNIVASAVLTDLSIETQPQVSPTAPAVLRSGPPEEAGADPARVAGLVETARGWVEDGTYPALVMAAARRGVMYLHESVGTDAAGTSITTETLFPLASITKPITATAILALAEAGLVGLNRPVEDYISEFQGEDKNLVLVRNLLTHTSGLSDEALYKAAVEEGVELDPDSPFEAFAALMGDPERWVRLACETPLLGPPNQMMVYADSNFDLLGEIVTRVSGLPLSEFAQDRIFSRMGMHDTVIAPTDDEIQSRVVSRPPSAPAAVMLEAARTSGSALGSVGGFSTAKDMTTFGQMFLNGGIYGSERILSQASITAMTRNQIPGIPADLGEETWPEAEWGFGWGITETKKSFGWNELLPSRGSYGHGGSGGVFLLIDPGLELVACFFSVWLQENESGLPVSNNDLFVNSIVSTITEL